MTDDETSPFGPVIFAYTRAQAIADGVLIDITDVARAAHFKVPVAMTATLWARCIETPARVNGHADLLSLWKLLYRVYWAIHIKGADGSRVPIELDLPDGDGETERVEFVAEVSGGDDGEPVMTIMFPDED
jgi:hypothetical protein